MLPLFHLRRREIVLKTVREGSDERKEKKIIERTLRLSRGKKENESVAESQNQSEVKTGKGEVLRGQRKRRRRLIGSKVR